MTNTPLWATTHGPAPDHPPLAGDLDADVCVVGLGGSGLRALGDLARRGRRVVGLDMGVVGGGAAGRNGGFLLAGIAAFHHDAVDALGRERAVALYRLTLRELERMAAETPDEVRLVGSLRAAVDDEEARDCAQQLDVMRSDDLPVESYDGPEGRGLLVPTDGVFHPLARCRQLAARAAEAGARLHERTRVTGIESGIVHTDRGDVRAETVIVAVDGHLDRVLPELSPRVRTARLQMLATAPAPEVRFPRPVYANYGYDYWQQLPDGTIALGGGRDIAMEREWTHDDAPSVEIQRHLDAILRDRLGVRAPVTHRWAASVGYTDTLLPIVEEVRPAVWAIGAYSGTGNVVGALLGSAVAERVATGRSEVVEMFRG